MKSKSTLTALVVPQGDSIPRVSSLAIAESFGKNHKYVLQKIKEIMAFCPSAFNGPNFRPVEYEDAKGQWRPQFLLTRDAFSLLVMGFTGAEALNWKLRYIEAFNAMEHELLHQRLLASPEGHKLIHAGLKLARRLTPERKREIRRAVRYKGLGLSNREIGRLMKCGPDKVRGLIQDHASLKGGAA